MSTCTVYHRNLTESDLHVPGYYQSTDPGAVGAGKLWIDTSGGTGSWLNKIRNTTDDGWEIITAPSDSDEKVKISSNDSISDYLLNKLNAGVGILVTEYNDGGTEKATLTVDTATIATINYVDSKIGVENLWDRASGENVIRPYFDGDSIEMGSGQIKMNNNKIIDLADPSNPKDAVNKSYVDTQLGKENLWDRLSGTTILKPYYDNDSVDLGSGDFTTTGLGTFGTLAGTTMTGKLILPQENTQGTPTLAFGDGDSGFYESTDDTVIFSGGGTASWSFTTLRIIGLYLGDGPSIQNEVSTSINPVFSPHSDDLDSGIGGSSQDIIYLIAGGIEGLRVTESASVITVDIKGNMDMNSKRITGVAVPTTNTDAVNRDYAKKYAMAYN